MKKAFLAVAIIIATLFSMAAFSASPAAAGDGTIIVES
jgi:hypothetical protein